MKSFELKPTEENVLNSILHDSIGRTTDLYFFVKMLNGLDSNYSISLDGPWGSGKTFFVKQAKMIFDAHNDFLEFPLSEDDRDSLRKKWLNINQTVAPKENMQFEPQVAIYYDAWKNDNDEDPIVSIVYSIMLQLKEMKELSLPSTFLDVAASIIDFVTNRDSKKILDAIHNANALDSLIIQKDLEEQINEFLDGIPVERGNRVIIFIDELDRCNPDFAVKLLERIKHYFINDRFTFVFSTNITELEHTIKIHYGDFFDASKYLDKFFDLRVSLPPIDMEKFYQSIRYAYYGISLTDELCDSFIRKYNLQMREVCKYVLLVKTAVSRTIRQRQNDWSPYSTGNALIADFFVPIAIGLKIVDTKKYNALISGSDPSPLFDFIEFFERYQIGNFLNKEETYNPTDKTKRLVTHKEKLTELYTAIFKDKHNSEYYIGQCVLYANAKERILQISGLLSYYSDYTVNEGDQ